MRDLFIQPPAFMASIAPIADRFDLKTIPLHLHEVLLSFLLYQSLDTFASPFISARLFPDIYPKLNRRSKSCIMSTLALYTILFDDERKNMNSEERVWGYTGLTGMCQGFAAGYFLYDLKISAYNVDILGVGSLMHACSSIVVSIIGFRPFLNYYGISFVLYEISTPMLNVHWFLDKLKMTGSRLQLYNGIALLATFFLARVVWGNYMSYWVYSDILKALRYSPLNTNATAAAVESAATAGTTYLPADSPIEIHNAEPRYVKNVAGLLPVAQKETMRFAGDMILPKWMAYTYIFSNTVLSLLNIYWFWKMVEAVRKRFDPKVDKEAAPPGMVANGFGGYEGVDTSEDAVKKEK